MMALRSNSENGGNPLRQFHQRLHLLDTVIAEEVVGVLNWLVRGGMPDDIRPGGHQDLALTMQLANEAHDAAPQRRRSVRFRPVSVTHDSDRLDLERQVHSA